MPKVFEQNNKITLIEYGNDNMPNLSLKEVANQIKASIKRALKAA